MAYLNPQILDFAELCCSVHLEHRIVQFEYEYERNRMAKNPAETYVYNSCVYNVYIYIHTGVYIYIDINRLKS